MAKDKFWQDSWPCGKKEESRVGPPPMRREAPPPPPPRAIDNLAKEDNVVSHPSYYTKGRVFEPIFVINDWCLGFNLGNVVKYISRAGRKGVGRTLEDLEKARFYLDFEIEKLKKEKDVADTEELKGAKE